MRKAVKIFFALLILSTSVVKAQFTKAELQINGVNCALCAKSTQTSMKALPFVSDVKPDLMRNLFIITFKKDAPIDFDHLSKVIHDEGFFISSLTATFNFDKVKITGNFFSYAGNTFQVMNLNDKALNGEIVITIVDKGFAPRSVSKKYLSRIADVTPAKPGRLYHVVI